MIPTLPLGTVTVGAAQYQLPLQFTGDFLSLAIIFFVLAVVAAVLGAQGVAGMSMEIAKWLVLVFIVLAIISLVL